jgi:phage gp36-like protein
VSYVTPAQLAEKPGAKELAESASTSHQAIVDAELMDLTLRGLPRDAFSVDDIAHADTALERIVAHIDETDALIDAYIGRRVSLPLSPVPVVLTRIARAVVRYELQKDRTGDARTDPIVRDYQDKLKMLEGIRDGCITIGPADPASASAPSLDVRIDSGDKVFGRDQLRNWR